MLYQPILKGVSYPSLPTGKGWQAETCDHYLGNCFWIPPPFLVGTNEWSIKLGQLAICSASSESVLTMEISLL